MRLPVFFCFAVLCAAPCLVADDATKNAKIEEIFRLTKVDQLQKRMIEQVKTMIPAIEAQAGMPGDGDEMNSELRGQILDAISTRVSWDKMKPAYTKLYADAFTEQEIDGILAFYKSPPGQAMLTKMPDLASKSLDMAQQQMAGLYPEIRRIVADYSAKHQKPAPAPDKP